VNALMSYVLSPQDGLLLRKPEKLPLAVPRRCVDLLTLIDICKHIPAFRPVRGLSHNQKASR
jgi:hypothetical protein